MTRGPVLVNAGVQTSLCTEGRCCTEACWREKQHSCNFGNGLRHALFMLGVVLWMLASCGLYALSVGCSQGWCRRGERAST
eukprot:831375-Karenia_brevis.AAC.1